MPFFIFLWISDTSLAILSESSLEGSNWDVSIKQYYSFSPQVSPDTVSLKERLPLTYFDCALWYQNPSFRQKARPHQLIYLNGCENLFSTHSKDIT